MSLAEIKKKETKGKKNALPKLRTLLVNPHKQHCPVLPENELLEFTNIIKLAINASPHEKKVYATKSGIHLGLESSLRAINAQSFSCVFISLSLRPAHLIRLIATSATVKTPTAPIYAQPRLEELTYELFGVRALTMVLPLDLEAISHDMEMWIAAHKKPLLVKEKIKIVPTKNVKKPKTEAKIKVQKQIEPKTILPSVKENSWSGDYISCSNDNNIILLDQQDVQLETQRLGAALSNMVMKAKQTKTSSNPTTPATITTSESLVPQRMDVDSDEDTFLPADLAVYKSLTVHQMRANPDKKPKKKRNKNKTKT
ncbi:CG42487, partial [Drosophila busckii]